MTNIEKHIQRLKELCNTAANNGDLQSLADLCYALSVLENQKPAEPKIAGLSTHWYECGNCRTAVNPGDKFCRNCGKAVAWVPPKEESDE